MVGREPVLEADALVADLASAVVGERQHLFAAFHGAPRLLLLARVAGPRLLVPLQRGLLLLARPLLHGHGAGLAHDHESAVVVRLGADVSCVAPVLQAEDLFETRPKSVVAAEVVVRGRGDWQYLFTAMAGEGQEVELIAVFVLAVLSEIGKRLRSSPHGYSCFLLRPPLSPLCLGFEVFVDLPSFLGFQDTRLVWSYKHAG